MGTSMYDDQYVGDYLASKGYVVISIDALFWGERGRKEGVRYESQQAFTNIFKQMYKKTPNEYRMNEEFYPLQLRL